ncbi:MAG: hypothetical protein Q4F47_05970, partial [Bacteroidaceae bacterium]|nr:hypothetical protein [Bacteroidaceae bacterium]
RKASAKVGTFWTTAKFFERFFKKKCKKREKTGRKRRKTGKTARKEEKRRGGEREKEEKTRMGEEREFGELAWSSLIPTCSPPA